MPDYTVTVTYTLALVATVSVHAEDVEEAEAKVGDMIEADGVGLPVHAIEHPREGIAWEIEGDDMIIEAVVEG